RGEGGGAGAARGEPGRGGAEQRLATPAGLERGHSLRAGPERERRDHARAARRGAGVDRDLGGRSRLRRLTAVAIGPPERLVVRDDRLRLPAADGVAIERLPILG